MSYTVRLEQIPPRTLAAVRRTGVRDVGAEFRQSSDLVWDFLKRHPGLRTDGHNVFLYHHVDGPDAMTIDFGVEVARTFGGEGEVQCVVTPAGEAAVTVHRGPYHMMRPAHAAIHQWRRDNGRSIGSHSLEVYGDWSDDPSKLETTIQYLLR